MVPAPQVSDAHPFGLSLSKPFDRPASLPQDNK